MKRLNSVLAGIWYLTVLGCAAHQPLVTEFGDRTLARRIHSEIIRSGLTPNMGVRVISLRSGKTVYTYNADHLFMPASNNKIFTAASALHYLGPQYRFITRVFADSNSTNPQNHRLGHLVLKGSGDPDLTIDQLEALATRLAKRWNQIDTLILDNTVLDTIRLGNGWMWDEGPWWYAARIDPLTLNDNCIDFSVTPGDSGEAPQVTYFPETEYITFTNRAVTVTDTMDFKPWEIDRDWENAGNHFELTGEMLTTDKAKTVYRNIDNPTRFTGQVFRELLLDKGIQVGSVIRVDSVSPGDVSVDSIVSQPLRESVVNLLKSSDNLTAELLIKTIGHEVFGGKGTWKKGLTAEKIFLYDSVGVDTGKIRIVDGSGVSRYNLTSPEALTKVLAYVYSDFTLNAEFMAALPTGGWDGTLENRMQDPLFDRRIRAKTGTLSGATALSGFAFTRQGEPLAFSIMMNGYVGSSRPYKYLEDRICYQLIKTKR
ncbi:MAG: D-alanyl-D-alanine carboxypeptidase/D-alanyl-D-alanine-endopeptidase [FCB group bacterium]|nr:D-alanyl-D-alanine carboxypeptidase/D-alanyl-D-alanine-endopeptidase [FCB group bacterium]